MGRRQLDDRRGLLVGLRWTHEDSVIFGTAKKQNPQGGHLAGFFMTTFQAGAQWGTF